MDQERKKKLFYPNIRKLSELGILYRVPMFGKCEKIRNIIDKFKQDKIFIFLDNEEQSKEKDYYKETEKMQGWQQYWLKPTNKQFIEDIEKNNYYFSSDLSSIEIRFDLDNEAIGYLESKDYIGYRIGCIFDNDSLKEELRNATDIGV